MAIDTRARMQYVVVFPSADSGSATAHPPTVAFMYGADGGIHGPEIATSANILYCASGPFGRRRRTTGQGLTALAGKVLVLWDIDRTLLYAGEVDQRVYREAFEEVVGRSPAVLPERGSGVTTPRVVRGFLAANDVPEDHLDTLAQRVVRLMPGYSGRYRDLLASTGRVMPGAFGALAGVRAKSEFVPTVVTGNLKDIALIKLTTFRLDRFLEVELGGYASDDDDRPSLVGVAQRRAGRHHAAEFSIKNTVVIGDSLEDVRTARSGGARIIAVASGTTSGDVLRRAGVDYLFEDLLDAGAVVRAISALGS